MVDREFFRYEHPNLIRKGITFTRKKETFSPGPSPMVRIGDILLPDEDGPGKEPGKEIDAPCG